MNLYSNKQKWKIILLIIALLMVGVSLFISNEIVTKVGERERDRVKQWADAIKKKAELVQLTDRTFSQLRDKERSEMEMWISATKEISKPNTDGFIQDYSLALSIINKNKDIPVILMDNTNSISGFINLDFDTSVFRNKYPEKNKKEIYNHFEDSLRVLAQHWKTRNPAFTIEVYKGLFMTYTYFDSKELVRLEHERDSLIQSFNQELIENKGMVPVLLIAASNDSIIASNLSKEILTENKLPFTIAQLKKTNQAIPIQFGNAQQSLLLYDDSPELKQLQYFPYIQFAIIFLFIFIGYLIFSTFRKAEQNQVWAGMAKETAHQLGTPLSSLMAWIELLKSQDLDPMIVTEMEKDITRLETVTDRFSKIGSGTKLEMYDIVETTQKVLNYLKNRISSKIELTFESEEEVILVNHNPPLFEWVIENITKNAVDAMESQGFIHVHIHSTLQHVHIDIKDSGKGIPAKQFKTIFQPGFTSKKRGWGLGLSLVKRIVNEYHKGKVFVLESEVNKGTTFRISLPKKNVR
jgi:two-component system, sporulation sensor kinase D